MLLTLMSNLNMFGSSSPAPSRIPDIEGGGGYHKKDEKEKVILDIINDDEESIILILQGFMRVNMFKNKYPNGLF